ncbi:MAG: hypothetical protein AB1938_01690 [Myxococcota bacterium]
MRVFRCPRCGSTDAGPDESRSHVDFTWMQCHACGKGGLCDSWERDFDWMVELDLPDGADVPPSVALLAPGAGLYDARPAAKQTAPPAPGRADLAGCEACTSADAMAAWEAMRARRGKSLVQESHFGVHLTQCACGQRFVVVFTERIDWQGGEDDQTWLSAPVTAEEASRLERALEADVPRAATEVATGRRFLVRSHPPGSPLSAWWCEDGFAIGPHD